MYNRILVINLMYIGDLLFTTPLLRTLRMNFKEAEIVVLADKKNCDVIKYNPHISGIISIDKKGYHNKFKNYLNLISDIRQHRFDLVINLHANERASAIAAFSGAKRIVGFAAQGFGLFFDKVIAERTDIHQVDAYMETLKATVIEEIDNQGLEMWIDEESQKQADQKWLDSCKGPINNAAYPVIGLNTGGSWPTKRWTKEGFAELADKLIRAGYGVAFFGGPMDTADVEEIVSMMAEKNSSRLTIFTGKTTLLEMAALVKKCCLIVSGDSGPMHIAVSQKIPVIALFGPSNSIRYAPYRQQESILIASKECLACGKHQCDGHECMKDITAKMVFDKIQGVSNVYNKN